MECNCRKKQYRFLWNKKGHKRKLIMADTIYSCHREVLNRRVCTFNFMSKEFTVMHRDQRVAEQGAEEIEEGDDAIGVLEQHGRPSWDQLQQSHRGAGGTGRINRKIAATLARVWFWGKTSKHGLEVWLKRAHPVIILVVMDVIRCQRCLRNRALKAKL